MIKEELLTTYLRTWGYLSEDFFREDVQDKRQDKIDEKELATHLKICEYLSEDLLD